MSVTRSASRSASRLRPADDRQHRKSPRSLGVEPQTGGTQSSYKRGYSKFDAFGPDYWSDAVRLVSVDDVSQPSLVNGEFTAVDGKLTGARPGRVLRSGLDTETVLA